ncbi:MAG: radical SAM protein, partial [bacterium]
MMLPGSDNEPDLWERHPLLDEALAEGTATIPLIRPPEILHVQITERCNFACPKCYLPELNATSPKEELSPQELKSKVLLPAAEVGIKKVVVTGGEPFLYRGLFEVLECSKRVFSEVFLGTSGFFLDDANIDRVLDTEIDYLQVSLDALSPDLLKKIMGCGSVDRLWPNLERFVQQRNRRGAKTRVVVATVIDRQNIDEIPAILDRCQAIGVDSITLQAYHDYDTVYRSEFVEWPVCADYSEDFLRRLTSLIEQVIAAKRNGSQLFPHAEEYFRNLYTFFADRGSLRIRCQADDFLFVDSRGFIRGCIFSAPLGHVDNGISTYLTSPQFHRFVDFKQDCHLCTHGC